MKQIFIYTFLLTVLFPAAVSCSKQEQPAREERGIAFRIDGPDVEFGVETKVSVTNVAALNTSGFNVSATTGTPGSETGAWNNITFTKTGELFKSSKVWPSTDPGYHFYACNVPMTFGSTGTKVSVTNDTDVVCAYLESPSYENVNNINFGHIFSRIRMASVIAVSGYTITDVSMTITPKTGGVYNIRTGVWESTTTGSAYTLRSAVGSNNHDLYLVPGSYTFNFSWTATIGEYTKSCSQKVKNVVMSSGYIYDYQVRLGADAEQIKFEVSVNPWGTEGHDQGSLGGYDSDSNLPLYFDVLSNGNIKWSYFMPTHENHGSDTTPLPRTIEYSKDNINWTSITSSLSGVTIPVTAGERVYFRGDNTEYGTESGYSNGFNGTTCTFKVGGRIMSLFNSTGFATQNTFPSSSSNYYLNNLFWNCSTLISAEDLILPLYTAYACYINLFRDCTALVSTPVLPSATVEARAYEFMFCGCTSLKVAPLLPASNVNWESYFGMFKNCLSLEVPPSSLPDTDLNGCHYCYGEMFYNCSSLIYPPAFPSDGTVLGDYCCSHMFTGCSSLTYAPEMPWSTIGREACINMFQYCSSIISAPELPATTIASGSYAGMFESCYGLVYGPSILPVTDFSGLDGVYRAMFSYCSSLKVVPVLPATTLCVNCYNEMFNNCTSLEEAPFLPATTLASHCYDYMFFNCNSLRYVKAMFTTTPSADYTTYWLIGTASGGTFVKNSAASWNVTGDHGIPSSWTVETASL